MNFEQTLEQVNRRLMSEVGRSLTEAEIAILLGAWEDRTYEQVAEGSGYSVNYLQRDVGPKFWKLLSDTFGRKLSKTNARAFLEQQVQATAQQGTTWANLQVPSVGLDGSSAPSDSAAWQPEMNLAIADRYVERPPIEAICYEALLQPGALIRIKAPTLMGKTMLVNRILAQLADQGYRVAGLSLDLADRQAHFTSLDRFLRWFCINLSRELGMPNQLEDYWDEAGMGSKVSCTTYLEEYLLSESDRPLVFCLDKVDLLFPYPAIYEDFFGLLRSWYEKARSRRNWQKLRLMIVHATNVYIQLNIYQSPFNVGLPIELPEFTMPQVQQFAQHHGLTGEAALLKPLVQMVGGHPYLLEQAFEFHRLHPQIPLLEFLATACTDAGIYANHLRQQWVLVQQQPELVEALGQVVTAHHAVQLPPIAAYQLQSMGLIKLSGNLAEPRCQLYKKYFQSWVESFQ